MWDQPFFGVSYRVDVPTASLMVNSAAIAALVAQEYLQNSTGSLTAPPGMLAWEKVPHDLLSSSTVEALAGFPSDWPQVEYLMIPAYLGYNRNYRTADPRDGYNYATIAAAIISPLSRGNITISSGNMLDLPVINPNWLTAPADVALALAAVKRIRQIWSHMGNITIDPEVLPGRNVTTNSEILGLVRASVIMFYHAVTTCKMEKLMIVSPLWIRKQEYLVSKGSGWWMLLLFPFLTPGHPQSGVYMLAEKIADDIINGS